ncbi:WD and tetratricopeptide repeats protein 1 isoform X2 [Lingula anatina]|uniref:WD and tetratricopeptide repeats protein 1 isoform X1 n=1 Tax=Lingula anatina TaxID=7574 RepID=A0A1S3K4W2_LINAN|nr:WD and tetratricopeptide repeats protein 1 isoform X1 [Lingula anatina]XP_023933694.1 WD and tetratricopeptide repeats protein 1 isoform X2 [Lingula anatina]|eukprot:XP_013417552.1 WD and tetratricopeptide repeats protein 1 isoform X1 [Lingula anatina]
MDRPTLYNNLVKRLYQRETQDRCCVGFQRAQYVTPDLVSRIGLETELEGHAGCVNCLEWNHNGSILASGSDDCQVILWDPLRHRKLTTIQTRHQGNIFTVKFLPSSNDGTIVTGAADCKIRVHDVASKEITHVFSCHAGRVKRVAVAPNVPFMFWSAAEDGTIMQFDLREPESAYGPSPHNVLINLNAHMGPNAEAKCISINPYRPELLAVGANDPYARLYDRRMLSCKSIRFPNENTPRSPWDRQNLIYTLSSEEEFDMPRKSATYFVGGHLPQKLKDFKKRYRTLASTYVTFGPDGTELLVNLGGEQIYLFDINKPRKPQRLELPFQDLLGSNGVVKEAASCSSSSPATTSTNGYSLNGTTNGVKTNGMSKHIASKPQTGEYKSIRKHKYEGKPLSPSVDLIRQKANIAFEKQEYTEAVRLYNRALIIAPEAAVLYGNRAAAFMKRGWDGDLYAALRDCHTAIHLDTNHLKAHFRLARCLYELTWTKEAFDCLTYFKSRFPDHASSHACEALDRDIKAAIFSKTEEDGASASNKPESSPSRRRRSTDLSELEKYWREEAYDYTQRFCGHCNTTTDIKEANYFGCNGQYIVAGSDDGSFFVWDKITTNMVRVLRGDDSIVNCLQPHPSFCMLATSGIDPVVRLWSPRPEDRGKDDREVVNSEEAASANQRRMNTDPLEVMLMNMGYRITNVLDEEEEGSREGAAVQCRPS